MKPQPTLVALHDAAREIARIGGTVALKWFGDSALKTEYKNDDSPVTVADREAENAIRAAINKRFPDHGIVGEEHGESAGTATSRWYVDPIDGTKTFVRGVPLFTTLLAYEDSEGIQVGVIYAPATGKLVSAYKGGGAWNERGERVSVSNTQSLADAWVMTTDPADLMRRRPELAEELYRRSGSIRTWADAYGYMLLACGQVDAMLDPIMSVWDIAPLSVIIREAGGVFSDIDGHPGDLGTSVAAAATAALHGELISCGRS